MNAEFLEKNIVISSKTVEGTTTYSTPKVRKNLAPISFIGAVVVTDDDLTAYPVTRAVFSTNDNMDIIGLAAGPYSLAYTIATGEFVVLKF